MDLVFSIDSIITAVGMVKEVWVMYVAVIVTVIIMLFAAEPISNFVNKHPAFKILALSFLLLIGFSPLIVEGLAKKFRKVIFICDGIFFCKYYSNENDQKI
jgi:predicted tellurium resistance membrane protein TerC